MAFMNNNLVQIGCGLVLITMTGCASVPLGLKVAALAGSGVSLVMTGKTLPDHALSSILSQDCRVTRLVKGRNICASSPSQPTNDQQPDVVIIERRTAGHYVVIGSFANVGNAHNWGKRFAEFAPQVIRIESRAGILYRVAVGPLTNGASAMLRDQFQLAGIENFWSMTVCGPATAQGDCVRQIANL